MKAGSCIIKLTAIRKFLDLTINVPEDLLALRAFTKYSAHSLSCSVVVDRAARYLSVSVVP
jgi:hypothetical protein